MKFLQYLFDGLRLPKFWLTYGEQFSKFNSENGGLEIGFTLYMPFINHPMTFSFNSDRAIYNIPGIMFDFLSQMRPTKLLQALAPIDWRTKGGMASGIRT